MVRKKKSVDLVEESHKAVTEIAAARQLFASGKLGSDQASAHIGLFNSTARVINTAIDAERWQRKKDEAND